MSIKAVIFDFNGTLFNDTNFHLEAWQQYIRKRFSMEMSIDEVRRGFIGPSNSIILSQYFGDRLSPEEARACSVEKEAEYRRVARSHPDQMHLMDGAPEFFDLLVARGIPFALATASELDNVNFYLEDLGLKKWFAMDRIVYDDGTLASKPNPAYYLEAMRRLNMRPEECLVVEDSVTGIQAAIASRAGRIVAIDRTAPRDYLENTPEIYACAHDFYGFERFLV